MRLFGMLVLVVVVAQCGQEATAAPAKVVDLSVVAKQPNLKVVENKITGNDPLSVRGECLRHTTRSSRHDEP